MFRGGVHDAAEPPYVLRFHVWNCQNGGNSIVDQYQFVGILVNALSQSGKYSLISV